MRFSLSAALLFSVLALVNAIPIGPQEIATKSAQGLRLLRLSPTEDPVWKTEEEKLDLKRAGVGFMDVTEVWTLKQSLPERKSSKVTFPAPSHQSQINPILSTLSTANMQARLTTLSAYNNRYYTSTTGQTSAQWIYDTVSALASGHSGVTVSKFSHSWVQFSVIAKIAGTNTNGPITILGAHEDSINLSNPKNGRAPGQDDDGSGTVNNIEIFRALLAANFKPTNPVEIHWYSGEEAGLLGSQAIAASYASKGANIKAFLELDMTAYFAPGSKEVIAIEADYIDSGVNTFVKSLVDTYSSLDWAMDTKCGYACSDHASWYEQGYPTSMLYEAITGNDDPYIHSASDTTSVSGFSWAHSLEFAKVALAFVYELSA